MSLKSKRRLVIVIAIMIIIIFAIVGTRMALSTTPEGAFRMAFAECGYPIRAFTVEIFDVAYYTRYNGGDRITKEKNSGLEILDGRERKDPNIVIIIMVKDYPEDWPMMEEWEVEYKNGRSFAHVRGGG
jgi:hypothetical protein